jgi:hypothetical protein
VPHQDEPDWSPLEDAVKRFVAAWRQGPRPVIDAYLTTGELRHPLLIELVHTDLELGVKAGEAARAEEYLARYPELAGDRAVALELIVTEYRLRCRGEPDLTPDDYLRRFPQYREELAEQLAPTGRRDGPSPPRAGADGQPIPEVPGYDVLEPLGTGGMGVVYKARQRNLGRLVALKFVPAEYAHDPEWLRRFRREALTASALNHPNICTIYDTGECAGRPYLSMELVVGGTLEALVGQRLGPEELTRLIGQAGRALAAAHAAGVVHRDVKPANLMVRDDGIVKVLDFGLARRVPHAAAEPGSRYTDPGALVGTPMYMSPEQARSEPVGTATDVFSLGVVLYELATGRHPFETDSKPGVLHAIVTAAPLAPSRRNAEVPAWLEALVLRMLEKDPNRRPTAAEVEAALTGRDGPSPVRPAGPRPAQRPTVGREREAAALRAGFAAAAAGSGVVLCVTGEPGIGKSTLVEDFLAELAACGRPCRVARGRCSERLAGTEAYLPVLEVLDSLARAEAGDAAARALRQVAPAWYSQVAPSTAGGKAQPPIPSQERLKRELFALVEEVSRPGPLVVFLDDIHWADASTVDVLAYLGGRCARLRLLLVLTYRPTEMLLGRHPFLAARLELQRHGTCREISLGFLGPSEVASYMSLAFPGHHFPADFAGLIHARTEGSPLFLVDLLRYLRDRGVIAEQPDGWALAQAVPDFQRGLPESVRSLIQMKIALPGESDGRLLSAASVQGHEFDSAVVARVLGKDAAEVEERLEVLDRVHGLVRLGREHEFPDGTLTQRYHFVHALYQNALYAALQPTRKAAWSAAAAQALLAHHGEQTAPVAGELALLFEAARDWSRAAAFFLKAARHAAGVSAARESAGLVRRGLAALGRLPDTPARARLELPLQITLGHQVQVAHGFATAELEQAFHRARELCKGASEDRELFPALWELWMYFIARADSRAAESADQLLAMARGADDPALLVPAHVAQLATNCIQRGDFLEARRHLEAGMALYDAQRHKALGFPEGHDPGTRLLCWGAWSLLILGYPDQAAKCIHEALTLAKGLAHPYSLAFALADALLVDLVRRNLQAARERSDELVTLATELGFPSQLAIGTMTRGFVLAAQGREDQGLVLLREGWAAWQATGALVVSTFVLSRLAEALGNAGQIEEGLATVAQGLAFAENKGEHFVEAELYRLQGELLLLRRKNPSLEQDQAESCFGQALAIARRQQAKWWELGAATGLCRLYQQQGRGTEVRPLLAETYDWFTEGWDTPDVQEAKALLNQV